MASNLLQDLTSRSAAPKKSKRCAFGHVYDSLTQEEQEAMDRCFAGIEADKDLPQSQRVFTVQWLVDTLAKHGYQLGRTTVAAHLNEICNCDK